MNEGQERKFKDSLIHFTVCIIFTILLYSTTLSFQFSEFATYILVIGTGIAGFFSLIGIVPPAFKIPK